MYKMRRFFPSWSKVCHAGMWTVSGAAASSYSCTCTANIRNDEECKYREYTLHDVSQHNNASNGLWIAFGDGVYDVTDFQSHVGGNQYIQMIAGGRLEPFWTVFSDHLRLKLPFNQLESYRIGNLAANDQLSSAEIQRLSSQQQQNEFTDFYHEPFAQRAPLHQLVIMRMRPFVAEPRNELLSDSFLTPNALFYTRNHFPVPHQLNEQNYTFNVYIKTNCHVSFDEMMDEFDEIPGDKTWTLTEIKQQFENIELVSTLQCAGNRAYALQKAKSCNVQRETFCQNGFISNAKWKGVRLRDVLLQSGYDGNDEELAKYKFVTFYGYDSDLSAMHYAVSVPVEHIMDDSNDCLLAFEMNGEPLPKDHGYPLRVLLPGVAGCRSVKWLAKIQLTEHEVQSVWQKKAYHAYDEQIYDMPVMSVISKPVDGQRLPDLLVDEDGFAEFSGVAWSGGGRGIVRVEISLDDGETWRLCELQQEKEVRYGRNWSWTLWKYRCDVTKEIGVVGGDDREREQVVSVVCRALDTSFNSQPSHVDDAVNGSMYVNNARHCIQLLR